MQFKSLLTSLIVAFLFFHHSEIIKAGICQTHAQENFAVYKAEELIDGAFLHDFLLLGPFPNPLPEGFTEYFHTDEGCIGFATDYLKSAGGEQGVKPYVGQSIVTGTSAAFTWQASHSAYDKVDLRKIFTPHDGVVSYAAIWIESNKQQEKLFGIGSNDGVKVWFNGEILLKVHKPRTVNTDDEYLRLKLKKGKNLLLVKIEQGFGGWGFVLRPVDERTAWNHVKENLDIALNSEFIVEDGLIKGTVGDKHIVGMLSGLPMAEIEFQSIHSDHNLMMKAPLGTYLELPVTGFPEEEYAISISSSPEDGPYRSTAYMSTTGDVVEQTKGFIYKELPGMPPSVMADYYNHFMETTRWLDQTNKLWQHPYGYRRYLDGLKRVHEGAQKLIESDNPFDGLFPPPREIDLTNQKCRITSGWTIHDPSTSNDFISSELDRVWKLKYNSTPVYTNDPNERPVIHLEISDPDDPPAHEGSYILHVERNNIVIKSRSRQGLNYGVNTLLQALVQKDDLPVGYIIDWPEYPVRSTLQSTSKLTPEFRQYIEQIVRLRYNVVYVASANYLELKDEQKVKDITEVFDFCKSRFIEPVPYFETFGAGTITRVSDPCLDEGVYHEKEPWQVPEKGIIELNVPRILDCPGTTIHVFIKDGTGPASSTKLTELIRDIDYKILSTEKPIIQILNGDLYGTELLLSYDAVDFSLFPHPASCPSDPRGWEIQEEVISNVITKLHPKSRHISQDEAGLIKQCSRLLSMEMIALVLV